MRKEKYIKYINNKAYQIIAIQLFKSNIEVKKCGKIYSAYNMHIYEKKIINIE